jgi:hypothetical protein
MPIPSLDTVAKKRVKIWTRPVEFFCMSKFPLVEQSAVEQNWLRPFKSSATYIKISQKLISRQCATSLQPTHFCFTYSKAVLLIDFFCTFWSYHSIPWRDSISRPIAPISSAPGEDDSTRPRRQGVLVLSNQNLTAFLRRLKKEWKMCVLL